MKPDTLLPITLSVRAAIDYSSLTRSFIYANRASLDWRKAGRRSLITRASLDALLAALPRATVAKKISHTSVPDEGGDNAR